MKKANNACAKRFVFQRCMAGIACALLLCTVSLSFVSCTRNEMSDPKDTAGTTDTAPSGTQGGSGMDPMPGGPLDPDAGTVNPDAAPGDPPADSAKGRSFRSHAMQ